MDDTNPNSNRKLVVVLGMHRSGTSAITNGLQVVGVELGDKLMPPLAGVNEKGFWEDLEIVDLNVEMLAALKSDWHFLSALTSADVKLLHDKGYVARAAALLNAKLDQFPTYGFKDPRTSKLLPFWIDVFEAVGVKPYYVLAIRNPISVEKSLAKRNAFDPNKSHLLWIKHVVTSLNYTRQERLIVIDYDRLMQDPDSQMNRLSHFLDTAVDQSALNFYKTKFLDKNLRHTVFGLKDLQSDPHASLLMQEIYASLLKISEGGLADEERPCATLTEKWATEFEHLQFPLRLVDALHRELVSTHAEAGQLKEKIVKTNEIDQQLRARLTASEKSLRHLESLSERQKLELVSAHVETGQLKEKIIKAEVIDQQLRKRLTANEASLRQLEILAERQKLELVSAHAEAGQLKEKIVKAKAIDQQLRERLAASEKNLRQLEILAERQKLELVSAHAEAGQLKEKIVKAEAIDQQLRERLAASEENLRQLEILAEHQKLELIAAHAEAGQLKEKIIKTEAIDQQLRERLAASEENLRQLEIPSERQKLELVSAHAEAGRLTEKIAQAETINQQLRERLASSEETLHYMENLSECQKQENTDLRASIQEIYASHSWRITAGLRRISRGMSHARRAAALTSVAIRQKGGIVPVGSKALSILRKEGLHGVRLRLRVLQTESDRALAAKAVLCSSANEMLFVPLYLDPLLDRAASARVEGISIAIHLHLAAPEALDAFTNRMAAFNGKFDLFVSINDMAPAASVRRKLKRNLPLARSIVVESGFSTKEAIVPFAVQFGERLSKYDVVGHFSLTADTIARDCALLDLLIGPVGANSARLAHIFQRLGQDAKLIYPDGVAYAVRDASFGVARKHTLTERLLAKYPELSLEAFPVIYSPNGSMFWAWRDSLQAFFKLSVAYTDDAANSLLPDDHLGHALERVLPILASRSNGGRIYRVCKQDSIDDYSEYEAQRDYAASIIHKDIKILSYYLPQFHLTSLNDEWHGKGFTEWTKVSAAQPLFKDHYQQHIPHGDIGYYMLDSPDMLRQQAEMMKQAGVYGQVFYHYWFSGRMILENPAKMLLANPDVEMPYCFCWANENWTRRWDGNEKEILLGQTYSAQDARDFINYLIPFFNDPRYIRIDGRPVLMVYRPSSIPDCKLYLNMWAEKCGKHGLPAPYVVAVLTRGATDPRDFGMDAGTERVLHDWTAGAVEDIKRVLTPYRPINGSILPYNEVADFYTGQTHIPDFTYFRGLVPQWDNTARYESEALAVHGSTPRKFQAWLETLVDYSQRTLPEDRRFIVVNAWNEWAEGAHLEPDSRYGYSYLNSVGRALSSIAYDSPAAMACHASGSIRVRIALAPPLTAQLEASADLARRFNHCLNQATRNLSYAFKRDGDPQETDFTLRINSASLFDATTINQMIELALANPDSAIVPNAYDRKQPIFAVAGNGAVDPLAAHIAPMVLTPAGYAEDGYKNVRMAQGAHCFGVYPCSETTQGPPQVTTIIRFHPHADFEELRNALYCLAAMRNCIVIPMIATQDLNEAQQSKLDVLLAEMNAVLRAPAIVVPYKSGNGRGDFRSKMLNESLKQVKTRYAAFLDYDDLLLSDAYEWLIRRMEVTGKAITFGRIYSTAFNSKTGGFIKRERAFEYGYTYADFLSVNHAPLHSFMLDVTQLDFSKVVYHDNQKYMEDYYLTLQLFREHNADWTGLAENMYIGDYIHSIDRNHTLALVDETKRSALLMNSEYQIAEQLIHEMRQRIAQGM